MGLRGLQRNRRRTRSKRNRCRSRLLPLVLSYSVVNLGVLPPPIQSQVYSLFIVSICFPRSIRVLWRLRMAKQNTRERCEYIILFSFFYLSFQEVSSHVTCKHLIIAFSVAQVLADFIFLFLFISLIIIRYCV